MTRPVQNSHQDVLRSVERLHRILEAAKLLNSTLDLEELTTIILRIVREEVGTDRGTVFVIDREHNQLRSIVAQGIGDTEIVVPIGQGVAGTVGESGETINLPDAYRDPRFDSSFDALLEYQTKDIYCMPIVNRVGDIVGVLELLNRSRPITIEDEEFLAGVSVHVGLALENARMHREIVEKRKIEQELLLAREIQENFYPSFPEIYGGVQIAASTEMCEAVGGDYLGYFPLKDGRFLVTVGDVSGKGIGAALVMTSLHATCRALVNHVHSIEHITNILNQTLVETTSASTFVTLMIALVDPVAGRLHYISAGHNPPVIVKPAGDAALLDGVSGPPVGLFSHLAYKREIRSIDPGSVLVIYTDGVNEAENGKDEQFGMERLVQVVTDSRKSTASHIHASIRTALKEFVGDTPSHDDATFIVLKFS